MTPTPSPPTEPEGGEERPACENWIAPFTCITQRGDADSDPTHPPNPEAAVECCRPCFDALRSDRDRMAEERDAANERANYWQMTCEEQAEVLSERAVAAEADRDRMAGVVEGLEEALRELDRLMAEGWPGTGVLALQTIVSDALASLPPTSPTEPTKTGKDEVATYCMAEDTGHCGWCAAGGACPDSTTEPEEGA